MLGQNVPVFIGIDCGSILRCPCHAFVSYCEPLSVSGLLDYDDYCCVLMSPSDVRDMNNQTPLHYSCCDGGGFPFSANLDMVRYLVERAHCDVSEFAATIQVPQTVKCT